VSALDWEMQLQSISHRLLWTVIEFVRQKCIVQHLSLKGDAARIMH